MFADPIANVTYNGVSQTLKRMSINGNKATYRTNDGVLLATISHQTTNNGLIRSLYRFDRNVDVNADNVLERHTVYVVEERPATGFSATDAINLATCVFTSLTASSNAGLTMLHGMEA